MGIDYNLDELVKEKIITKDTADILTVYFSIKLKSRSTWVSMGYHRLGISTDAVNRAIEYLVNFETRKKFKRFKWYYTEINKISPEKL